MSFEERIKARIAKRQSLGLSADQMQQKEKEAAKWAARRLPQLCQLMIQADINRDKAAYRKYRAEYDSLGGK